MSATTAKPIRVKFGKLIPEYKALWDTLTPQQKNVARCMAIGMGKDAIADHIGIAMKTLDTHRFNMLRKLDCKAICVPIIVLAANGVVEAFEI